LVLSLAALAVAHAGPESTRDSLDRLEELLALRIDDGLLSPNDVVPAIVVSVSPRYAESEGWFSTRALEVLQGAFGNEGLRLCEACMAPRAFVGDGRLTYQTGPVGLDEIVRLDDQTRGDARPARSAIWVDEHRGGIAVRIVDLGTARVLYAQNVDPFLIENENTQRMYTLSEELERRARGDSIAQAFVDFALYPGQHVSLDWTEQWGKTNSNLTGVSISAIDPVIGLGAAHYRRVDFLNVLVGAKLLVSVPTALVRIVDDGDVIDPLLTGVALTRIPFGRSNYGAIASISTNGEFGIGISLMNIRLLPVLP
jgi:hypothetical protein